jgi:hypothetical protein
MAFSISVQITASMLETEQCGERHLILPANQFTGMKRAQKMDAQPLASPADTPGAPHGWASAFGVSNRLAPAGSMKIREQERL